VPTDQRVWLMELLQTVFENQTFASAAYAYGERGRRVETVHRMGTLSEGRVTVRYDDFGNPVEEIRSDANREMRMDDGVVKTEERPSHVQRAQVRVSVRRTRQLDRADCLAATGAERR